MSLEEAAQQNRTTLKAALRRWALWAFAALFVVLLVVGLLRSESLGLFSAETTEDAAPRGFGGFLLDLGIGLAYAVLDLVLWVVSAILNSFISFFSALLAPIILIVALWWFLFRKQSPNELLRRAVSAATRPPSTAPQTARQSVRQDAKTVAAPPPRTGLWSGLLALLRGGVLIVVGAFLLLLGAGIALSVAELSSGEVAAPEADGPWLAIYLLGCAAIWLLFLQLWLSVFRSGRPSTYRRERSI